MITPNSQNLYALVVIASASLTFSASAAIININLVDAATGNNPGITMDGTAFTSSVAPLAYGGTAWNDVLPDFAASGASLVNSDNSLSGITIALTNTGGNSLPQFPFSYDGPTAGVSEIQDNYIAANNGFTEGVDTLAAPIELTIQGLDTSGQTLYDFAFIAQGDQGVDAATGQGASITIGGETKISAGTLAFSNFFIEGSNFVRFNGLTPDSGGNIVAELTNAPTGDTRFMVLNGLQIQTTFVPAPEPSSTFLLGFALLPLLGIRRR